MKKKLTPMRMCIGCGEMKTKKELLRVVLSSEGEISLDKTGKKAGRGAYICENETCFEQAYKAKRLERSFKKAIEHDVYMAIKEEINE